MDFDREKEVFVPDAIETHALGVAPGTTWPLSSVGELMDLAAIRRNEIANDGSFVGLYGADRMRAVVDHARKVDAIQSVFHEVGLHVSFTDEDFEKLLDN